jgi:hypothetical protein
MHIVGDSWRRAGFDFSEAITPPALVQDSQTRATFTGVYIYGAGGWEQALRGYTTALIPRPTTGGAAETVARGETPTGSGWRSRTMPRSSQRNGRRSPDRWPASTPRISRHRDGVRPDVIAFTKSISGPRGGPREATVWNIHEWEML